MLASGAGAGSGAASTTGAEGAMVAISGAAIGALCANLAGGAASTGAAVSIFGLICAGTFFSTEAVCCAGCKGRRQNVPDGGVNVYQSG